MTNVPFWVVPRSVDAALANGRPDPTKVWPANPKFLTSGASDEWRFGLGGWSLTGIVNRSLITLNGDPPTFDRNTLTLASGSFQGLVTPYAEVAAGTHCFVFRNISLMGMAAGTMSANTADGGWGIYRNGGNTLSFLTRGILSGDGVNGISNFTVGGVIPDGMAFFVAVSHSSTTRLSYVGGIGSNTKTGTRVISTGPRNVSLGNVWYSSGYSQKTQICAYWYIPATKTASDCDGYYASAKSFMRLTRGISVY